VSKKEGNEEGSGTCGVDSRFLTETSRETHVSHHKKRKRKKKNA